MSELNVNAEAVKAQVDHLAYNPNLTYSGVPITEFSQEQLIRILGKIDEMQRANMGDQWTDEQPSTVLDPVVSVPPKRIP